MNEFWDRLGISASILCVLHCLLTPVLVISVPLLGEVMSHEWFHTLMVMIVVPVAAWALWNGYRLHHKQIVLWLGGLGVTLVISAVTLGRNDFWIELTLMSLAGVILAYAHWLNLTVCRRQH